MSEYEIEKWTVQPVEGDDQIELVIEATDGNRWEYGIPFSRGTGRYTFEEIDIISADFGEEEAEAISERIDEVIAKICG